MVVGKTFDVPNCWRAADAALLAGCVADWCHLSRAAAADVTALKETAPLSWAAALAAGAMPTGACCVGDATPDGGGAVFAAGPVALTAGGLVFFCDGVVDDCSARVTSSATCILMDICKTLDCNSIPFPRALL